MSTYTKAGDTIKGDKIIAEARQIGKIVIINKSGRHKAQRISLKDNAKCIIERELRFIK
ncbi:hypothetical protein [Methanobrevibacter sp. UBA417]|jgi:hypothetical protein|uniref:hypothetical protein n=1 Tax=Methanobrevibacter sp. UBA417 TaxID=1915487 RepID=UPI0039B88076